MKTLKESVEELIKSKNEFTVNDLYLDLLVQNYPELFYTRIKNIMSIVDMPLTKSLVQRELDGVWYDTWLYSNENAVEASSVAVSGNNNAEMVNPEVTEDEVLVNISTDGRVNINKYLAQRLNVKAGNDVHVAFDTNSSFTVSGVVIPDSSPYMIDSKGGFRISLGRFLQKYQFALKRKVVLTYNQARNVIRGKLI